MFDYVNASDRDMLINHISRASIAHAYLFYGAGEEELDGTVQDFLKSMFCRNSDYYCGSCLDCERIEKNENPDVMHIRRDGRNIRIKQIRNLQYEASLSPSEYSRSVFVIHCAEDMTQEAANAFLKTLEEPEENTVMILTAQSREALLTTINSRCIPVRVKDKTGDADLSENEMLYLLEAVKETADGNSMQLINRASRLSKDRDKAESYILFLLRFYTDVLLFKKTDVPVKSIFGGYMEFVEFINARITTENLEWLIDRTMKTYEAVQYNVSMKSAFVNMLLDVEDASL